MNLRTKGWEAVKPARETVANPNVGEFLAAVRAEADIAAGTFEIYARKFRRLVAGVFGIRSDNSKHDHARGGYQKWLARVHAVRFSRINSRAIQRWKSRYISGAATNPLLERRARRTIASVLRSSKALFAPAVLAKLHIALPDPLPLAGVDVPRVSTAQYVSRISPEILFEQAQRELESPSDELLLSEISEPSPLQGTVHASARNPVELARSRRFQRAVGRERTARREMFSAFCLALFAGLRRDEIDTLTWKQIDFANGVIQIETNEFTRAKSEGSEVGVDIDPVFSEMLRSWMATSTSKFVIGGAVEAKPESRYHHYRCDRILKKLTKWLKAHGVEDRNALHSLRKEFGTQINRTHGLFAASAALRHSSIQLTRSVYVAKKDRAVFSLPVKIELCVEKNAS
ncbi:tyrosine-type recombinase/integrase [Horticoccus sp. 23ND18S-11]|uniref:tyrosine-type recombinase/integrase n=1 Tax=Horticoccus sp. 23ND18S-11 TaxID=3391832 RepID=UPI0039C963EA